MSAALCPFAPVEPQGATAFYGRASANRFSTMFTPEAKGQLPGPINHRVIWPFGNYAFEFDAVNFFSSSTATLSEGLLTGASSLVVAGVGCYDEFSTSSTSSTNYLTLTTPICGICQTPVGGSHPFVYQTLAREAAASASTVPLLNTPMDVLVGELEELRNLPEGWDGEGAAAPISDAIDDAASFVRSIGDLASRLEPTPDIDGSILLEIDDGGAGSFRFRGDRTIIHAIRGVAPGRVGFDGRTVPEEISQALDAAL
jgi:hypothetical protein